MDDLLDGIALHLVVSMISLYDKGKSYLSLSYGLLGGLGELLDSFGVVSKVLLATDKDDREPLTEMENLGDPLYHSANHSLTTQKFLIES